MTAVPRVLLMSRLPFVLSAGGGVGGRVSALALALAPTGVGGPVGGLPPPAPLVAPAGWGLGGAGPLSQLARAGRRRRVAVGGGVVR